MLDMLSISIFRVQEWIRMLFAQCAKKNKLATAVSLEGTMQKNKYLAIPAVHTQYLFIIYLMNSAMKVFLKGRKHFEG